MERRASAGSRGRAAQRRAGPAHARGGAARARARARPRAAAGAPAAGAAQWLCLAAVLTVTRCMCRKALLAALPGSLTSVCAWRPCRQTADPPPRTTQMQLEAPASACQRPRSKAKLLWQATSRPPRARTGVPQRGGAAGGRAARARASPAAAAAPGPLGMRARARVAGRADDHRAERVGGRGRLAWDRSERRLASARRRARQLWLYAREARARLRAARGRSPLPSMRQCEARAWCPRSAAPHAGCSSLAS